MVEKYPNQPVAHFALGDAYSNIWSRSYGDNAAAGQEAISEFEEYIKMADAADPVARFVPFRIKAMQGYMNGEYKWPPRK